jgi:L-malate glycosyltransferase
VNVAYLSNGYTPHDFRFLQALAGAGHQVTFVRLEEERRVLESRPLPDGVRLRSAGLSPPVLRGWQIPAAMARLSSLLKHQPIDLVHAGPVPAGSFLAACLGLHPLVSMSWGSDLLVDARRGLRRWMSRFALARSDALLCDCLAVRQAAINLGMTPERIVTFPWGVDLDRFHPSPTSSLRQELGWQECFVLLYGRSWEPMYGTEIVTRAFIQAAAHLPDLRMMMLGDGSLRPRVEHMLRQARVLERVYRPGRVAYDLLPDLYRAADVYLSASRSDGSSVTLLEAMACGLPAIVSDIPANGEWVEPLANGWLFGDGDSRQLEQAIRQAHTNRRALPAMGQVSRRIAQERADWSRNAGRIFEAYRLAMGRETAAVSG